MGDTGHRRSSVLTGYAAGIVAGVAYGMNPLFGKELMTNGATVCGILFFRYLIATFCMAAVILIRHENFRIDRKQAEWMLILGLLFSSSSLTLFAAYRYIPAGLATTVVYLYPVFTALIMVFLRQRPSWQSWVAIAASLAGVCIMVDPFSGEDFSWQGIALSALSALTYSMYLIIVNRAKRLRRLSAHTITFYALLTGTVLFLFYHTREDGSFLGGIDSVVSWMNLAGLGIVPTMIAMLALAVSTKSIGPTKTAVLGVAEPVTAIAIGSLVFSEPFTLNVALGVAVCIAAILFMVCSTGKAPGQSE